MKTRQFSLIDLIIIAVLVAIFIFIIIPNKPGISILSKEGQAIANLRTVSKSQIEFVHLEGGYASTIEELRDDLLKAGKPACLDVNLSGVVNGYKYTLKPAGDSRVGKNGGVVYTNFTCIAEPVKYAKDSKRSFYVDSTIVIRFEYGKPATKDSEHL